MRFTDGNIDAALAEMNRLHASPIALPEVIINAPRGTFFSDTFIQNFCKDFGVYEPMIHDVNLRVTGLSLVVFPHEYSDVRERLKAWFSSICASGGDIEVLPTKFCN